MKRPKGRLVAAVHSAILSCTKLARPKVERIEKTSYLLPHRLANVSDDLQLHDAGSTGRTRGRQPDALGPQDLVQRKEHQVASKFAGNTQGVFGYPARSSAALPQVSTMTY